MSTYQTFKNFLRYGKLTKVNSAVPDSTSVPSSSSTNNPHQREQQQPQQQQQHQRTPQQQQLDSQNHDSHKTGSVNPAPATDKAATMAPLDATDTGHGEIKVAVATKMVEEEKAKRSQLPNYSGLERYQLIEKMGDGAFSNVYKAADCQAGPDLPHVAIKVVRKFEMNNSQRANISKEVTIMRQLDHSNIIRLLDFFESRQYYFIVLELAPGGELFHQIVRLTYFSEDLARHVITQVAKALQYLHEEKGVVHRDIKPENILFSPIPFRPSAVLRPTQVGDEDKVDEGEFIPGMGAGGIGQIKIADFGLSKVVWETQTMTPCGTVGYTAPEIVKDERYSKSVDMWALGCVLYTLLCGFPPFYDESIEVLTEKVAKGQYTFLSPWWDSISPLAKDLIAHLLTVDPEKRFTIQEFLDHAWIRGSVAPAAKVPAADDLRRSLHTSKIIDGDTRLDFRSPGAVNLREVFDVGYAVHRQEEEGKRQKQLGKSGLANLYHVEEEVEEEDEDQITRCMQNTQIRDHDERQPKAAAPTQRGYGQHSAAVTAAARQQVRDRHRHMGNFELSLDRATLLGRRAMKPAPAVG